MMIGDYTSSVAIAISSTSLSSVGSRDSRCGACFRIDRTARGSFVRLLASITEIAAESLTVTDGIQGDSVSHRTLNQPQVRLHASRR